MQNQKSSDYDVVTNEMTMEEIYNAPPNGLIEHEHTWQNFSLPSLDNFQREDVLYIAPQGKPRNNPRLMRICKSCKEEQKFNYLKQNWEKVR